MRGYSQQDVQELLESVGIKPAAAKARIATAKRSIESRSAPSDKLLIARLECLYQEALEREEYAIAQRVLGKLVDVSGASRRWSKTQAQAKKKAASADPGAELVAAGEELLRSLAAGTADPASVQAFSRGTSAWLAARAADDERRKSEDPEDELVPVDMTPEEMVAHTLKLLRRAPK